MIVCGRGLRAKLLTSRDAARNIFADLRTCGPDCNGKSDIEVISTLVFYANHLGNHLTHFQVGPNWRDVAERCRRGHFQPLLLLYANPNGHAVDISTAPKDTTILPGYQHPDKDTPG